MEKKKLHRIVGVLILIAVVIIILPLVTARNDLPESKTLSVDAPAFPSGRGVGEDAVPVQTPEPSTASGALPDSMREPPPAADDSQPVVNPPESGASSAESTDSIDAPAPGAPESSGGEANGPPPASSESSVPAVATPTMSSSPAEVMAAPNAMPSVIPKAPSVSTSSTAEKASVKKPARVEVVASSAWAVQMGQFHNHTNAVRLANKLRNSGFKAFTRQVVSRSGVVSTRVYVGPESARASAQKMNSALHARMHLDGIVVPFEPLGL